MPSPRRTGEVQAYLRRAGHSVRIPNARQPYLEVDGVLLARVYMRVAQTKTLRGTYLSQVERPGWVGALVRADAPDIEQAIVQMTLEDWVQGWQLEPRL